MEVTIHDFDANTVEVSGVSEEFSRFSTRGSVTSRSHVSVSKNGRCCTKIRLCKLSFVILTMAGIIACIVAFVVKTHAVDAARKYSRLF